MRIRRRAAILAAAMLIGCGGPGGDEVRDDDAAQTTAESTPAGASETIVLTVPSMSCPLCARSIEARLEEEGVGDVVIDLGTKRVTAVFDPALITPAEISAVVEGQGFPVTESRRGGDAQREPER